MRQASYPQVRMFRKLGSAFLGLFLVLYSLMPSCGEANPTVSSYALQQALATSDHLDLFKGYQAKGFNIDSSYFSGNASGVQTPANFADFNADQQLYALLIDGRYDFNAESSQVTTSPIHPYVMGGMGVATTGHFSGASNLDQESGARLPLFRVGGGVAYRLEPQWNLSLDYKAGMATPTGNDQVFTGRGQQAVDLQTLNLGMHYEF